jgi:hypothetical protein
MAGEKASTLGDAMDYIGTLSVATKITTVLALAALALIVAYLLSSQWLSARRGQIDRAIAAGDDDALAALLGNVSIDLDTLDAGQKYALGRDQSRQRFWQKMVGQALMFAGFLALLAFVWALVQPKPAVSAERIGVTTMTRMLLFVPEAQRQELCARTLEAAACTEIVQSIAGLSREGPAKVEQEIANSLENGKVSTSLSTALKGLKPVQLTAGDAGGWDVVIRWCDGLFAKRNRARAAVTARALAQQPGERIAPGVTLGSIATAPATGRPGVGAYIAADGGAGEQAAAAAIRAILIARGITHYALRRAPTPSKWRIEVVECQDSNIRIGRAL